MANLPRSAKSGKDWTPNDLRSYNISLNQQFDPLQFFGLQELPRPSVSQELLDVDYAADMQEDRHAELINLLDLTRMTPSEDEHPVIDFTIKLLDVLGYSRRDRVARTKANLGFLTCGKRRYAEPDVCIFDRSRGETLVIIQVYKGRLDMLDGTESRLVAGAVAVFDENNAMRGEYGLRPLSKMVIPGIVMTGTSPIFLKIPITQELSDHICEGTYPPEETRVEFCYPPVPRPPRRRDEGMKPLENRREILECFEAFKAIVGI